MHHYHRTTSVRGKLKKKKKKKNTPRGNGETVILVSVRYDWTGSHPTPTKGVNSVSSYPRTTAARAIPKVKPSKRGMDTANLCGRTGCPESLDPCFTTTIGVAVGADYG